MPILIAKGRTLRIGTSNGSVVLYKNWTIGLKGSGLTQLTSALIRISQYSAVRIILRIPAAALKKLDNMNIRAPLFLKPEVFVYQHDSQSVRCDLGFDDQHLATHPFVFREKADVLTADPVLKTGSCVVKPFTI